MPSGDADSDVTTTPKTATASEAVSGDEATLLGHKPSGVESTVAAEVQPKRASAQLTRREKPSGLEPTIMPAYVEPISERKPSLETVGATVAADAHDLPELPVVDGTLYTVQAEIGRGGMGRVVAVRDRRLRRDVVIKVLHRGASTARFQREALITARLQHPSIVTVYDAGWLDGQQPFYAMERVRGTSLDRKVGEADDAKERLALLPHVIAIADAIAYAHSEGVIHRDLKPHNVLVGTYGETVVIDWGLAKDLRSNDSDSFEQGAPIAGAGDQTVAGAVMGTPAFMPPEQARGEPADERSDVYAIGAILYSVLSGSPPVSGERALEDAQAGAITPLREREPEVAPELASIVERAMRFSPHERYASAKELAQELRRYSTGQLVSSHQYSTGMLVRRWLRRHRTVLSIVSIATILLVVLAVLSIRQLVEKRDIAQKLADEMTESMHKLTEQKNRITMEHAQSLTTSDPSMALGLLRMLTPEALDDPRVQAIANKAAASGVGFELAGPKDDIEQLVIGKNNTAFTGSDDGHLWGWSVPSRRGDDLGAHSGPIQAIAISSDGMMLLTGSSDTMVKQWDLVTGQSKVLTGHTAEVRGVAFAPDNLSFVSTSEDHTMWLWSVASGEGKAVIKDTYPLRPIAWHPDSSRVWAGANDGRIVELDIATGKTVQMKVHADEVRALALSPDRTKLVSGGEDGAVFITTLADRKFRRVGAHLDVVRDVLWSLDGTRVVSAGGDQKVLVTPLDGKAVELLGNGAGIKDIALSPDGNLVAAAGIDGVVRVWPIGGGEPRTLRGHKSSAKAVEFTADSGTVVSTSDDDRVRLWPLAKPDAAPLGTPLLAWIGKYTNVR